MIASTSLFLLSWWVHECTEHVHLLYSWSSLICAGAVHVQHMRRPHQWERWQYQLLLLQLCICTVHPFYSESYRSHCFLLPITTCENAVECPVCMKQIHDMLFFLSPSFKENLVTAPWRWSKFPKIVTSMLKVGYVALSYYQRHAVHTKLY